MLDERKQNLLRHIAEIYAETGEPVGSAVVSEQKMPAISGATVRNEMQALERDGLVIQPHTSAGRVPTEKGWRYYIENLLPQAKLVLGQQNALLASFAADGSVENKIKSLAKAAAEMSGETVVVAFAPRDVYYTGLSNLFSKPEFRLQEQVVNLSQVIDHLDDVMAKVHTLLDEDISILLGSDNPFGPVCGSVLTMVRLGRQKGVFGLLGPLRMNYAESVAYIKFLKNILEK